MSEIITFRAGVCEFDYQSKLCTPNPLQGNVLIKPSEEAEGFYDFVWSAKDCSSNSGVSNIELILIPGETKWLHIDSSTNGRVFCLLFSSGEKYFFWLQEKHQTDLPLNELNTKDKQIFDKIQSILAFEEEHGDINMDGTLPQEVSSQQPIKCISDFLTRDLIISHIKSLQDGSTQLNKLYQFLPPNFQHTKDALIECITSPFYKQATDTLSKNLNKNFSGMTIAQSFGYEYSGEGIQGFLKGSRKKGLQDDIK